ncbi:MAG: hypothetical protein JNK15_05615, partial [Planctomycetes bacterium]|nr:hypothetical protein [Planctomycetota bacterium]
GMPQSSTVLDATALPNGQFAAAGLFSFGTPTTGSIVVGSASGVVPMTAPLGSWAAITRMQNGNLVLGGTPANGIGAVQSWNGTSWTDLGAGTPTTVADLIPTTNGDVVAVGARSTASNGPTVARFQGSTWSELGAPLPPNVRAIVRPPNGDLVLGGAFTAFAGIAANNIVRRAGNTWQALGLGVGGQVDALAVAPDGSILVAGPFANAGGGPANLVARWNGSAWSSLGTGPGFVPLEIAAGAGGHVLVRGSNVVAWWNGAAWAALPPTNGPLSAITATPEGDFLIGGLFSSPIGGTGTLRFANGVYSYTANQPFMAQRFGTAADGGVLAQVSGAGGALVLRLQGNTWTQLGGTFPFGFPLSLSTMPNGDALTISSPINNNCVIGRFDGTAWTVLDEVVASPTAQGFRLAITSTNGQLVVAGSVLAVDGLATKGLAIADSTCPASVATFGTGCVGAAGPVALTANNAAWLGGTCTSTVTGLVPGSLALHGIGTPTATAPLPLGAPGCSLFVAPIVVDVLLPGTGPTTTAFAVPRQPSLVGVSLRTQAVGLELDASGALVRLTSSNALDLVVGSL